MKKLVLVGERDLNKPAHQGIEASVALYNENCSAPLEVIWLATSEVTGSALASASGLWCVPGSPYTSTEGALHAIRLARQHLIPFFGTCGGFQHALMEFTENVLGADATHEELNPEAENPLIQRLTCSLVGGTETIFATDPAFAALLGASESQEEFNCNFGVNDALTLLFAGSVLRFVARDAQSQVRAFLLTGHPFFLGTLFQPERRALKGELHPLVRAFFQATAL